MSQDDHLQASIRIIAELDSEDGTFNLDFPFELPILQRVPYYPWNDGAIADRITPLVRWANRQTKLNVGRFAREIPFVAHTFAEFLAHLVTTPGLEAILASSRYSLKLRIGRCFDRQTVARTVVQHILRSFYPEWTDREIEFTMDQLPTEPGSTSDSNLEPLHFSI